MMGAFTAPADFLPHVSESSDDDGAIFDDSIGHFATIRIYCAPGTSRMFCGFLRREFSFWCCLSRRHGSPRNENPMTQRLDAYSFWQRLAMGQLLKQSWCMW